jgi:hypothetical protein
MIITAFFCLLAAHASPSTPITALKSPILTLSAQADRVVLGEVLTTRTVQEDDNKFTVATVRVWETLQGEEDPIVEVKLPGAMLAQRDLSVHGQAKLIPGFEMLLFLQGEQVVGMGAGAFVIFGKKAWRTKVPGLPADPQSVGTHAPSLYVSHDIADVRATLQ